MLGSVALLDLPVGSLGVVSPTASACRGTASLGDRLVSVGLARRRQCQRSRCWSCGYAHVGRLDVAAWTERRVGQFFDG